MISINRNIDYYSLIPKDRDIDKLPKNSSEDTSVGYISDLTEEDRIVRKVLKEHYEKMHRINLSQPDPMAYIRSKYCDVTSPNFCHYMTKDQRDRAYRTEKRMLQTGEIHTGGFGRYDYALRNYKGIYIGGYKDIGYKSNTDKEKQYARRVINQQISNLFSENGINLNKEADLKFTINPYTYKLTATGDNIDNETLLLIETLLNKGDNAKNLWIHAWRCMHDSDNEIVNSQANNTKADQCSLWHQFYNTTGYDVRNAKYINGKFIMEDGTDLLALYKKKAYNIAVYELYSNELMEFAKNGWNTKNDLVIKIGYDINGLYDIGQLRGYGETQSTWIDDKNTSIFDAKI